MKIHPIANIGIAILAAATLLLATSAQAGEMASTGKKVLMDEPTLANLIDPVTGELSAGYDSIYMFRGYNLGQEAPWVGAEFYVPLGIFDVALIYNYYNLGPEAADTGAIGIGDQNEVGINLATTVGILDLGFEYHYNFDAGESGIPSIGIPHLGDLTHYYEPSVGTTFEPYDYASLAVGAAADFYSNQFSHLQYTAALPIRVSETVTFEPYLAYIEDQASGTLAADKARDHSDHIFGASSTPRLWHDSCSYFFKKSCPNCRRKH